MEVTPAEPEHWSRKEARRWSPGPQRGALIGCSRFFRSSPAPTAPTSPSTTLLSAARPLVWETGGRVRELARVTPEIHRGGRAEPLPVTGRAESVEDEGRVAAVTVGWGPLRKEALSLGAWRGSQ
ncbi:hypothetical protein NDU88_003170 [Pleurodeles waltl]|uniref:Uncharacterized protein n=1 Tax=Pleurodeles waltl TaxID=8319 RepID=A0AAV7UDB8_PLEWA|nr:hypothetical protein NDU88_003170 [Pleurodeles waltl]